MTTYTTSVEEITLGNNFFTSSDFIIERLEDGNVRLEPHVTKDNYHKLFMDYIYANYKDALFQSGKKYELDESKIPYLIRTKERMEIDKIDESVYIIGRTNEYY